MNSRMMLFLSSMLLAVAALSGASSAKAADFNLSVGGGNNGYRYHDYRTVDPVYGTWYPETTSSYVYSNNAYTSPTYVTPYVYSTPSVEFNSWYGNGYRSHSGSYGGGRGYSGGGYSSGNRGGSRR